MRANTHALLAEHDHPTECESPPGFDRDNALRRVKGLHPALQLNVGVALELDDRVQDASFYCDLVCYREASNGTNVPVVCIRFSAFGQLVTATWADDFDAGLIPLVVTTLREAGYTYVEADELEERYTGKNPYLGDQTWWIRFFDYL